jgi:chromate transporter
MADEAHYLDIVTLCQFLPGPASSQTGITLGILRAMWRVPPWLVVILGAVAASVAATLMNGMGI